MDLNDFDVFMERRKEEVRTSFRNKRYKQGYRQAMKDACEIIEKSEDLYDLQSKLKFPNSIDLFPNISSHYEEGYEFFIKQIKSEVHRRKKPCLED